MAAGYAQTWKRLKGNLNAITKQIEEAEAAGKIAIARVPGSGVALEANEYSISWLGRQRRYRQLLAQTEREMELLARRTTAMTEAHQAMMRDMGIQHSTGMLDVSMGPAPAALKARGLGVTWNSIPTEALENLVGVLSDGSPLDYKFAGLPKKVANGIRDEFAAGFAQGVGPRQIAANIERMFGDALSNALVTVRTEGLRAYRTAAHENYRANDDVVKGWIWTCAHNSRTCAACWGMDGSFHELTEELIDHPSGRCSPVPVTKSWAELFPATDLGDYTETAAKPWNPDDNFKRLAERDQKTVLGRARYRAYSEGKLELTDIPKRVDSPIWGDHYRVKTLSELGIDPNLELEETAE